MLFSNQTVVLLFQNGEDRIETKAVVNVSETLGNSSRKMSANTDEPLSNPGVTNVNLNNSEAHNNSNVTAENTTATLLNNTSVSLSISGVLTNLRSLKERTSQRLSSRGIVEVVNLINNLSPEKLLRNTTQRNKDIFAKVRKGAIDVHFSFFLSHTRSNTNRRWPCAVFRGFVLCSMISFMVVCMESVIGFAS